MRGSTVVQLVDTEWFPCKKVVTKHNRTVSLIVTVLFQFSDSFSVLVEKFNIFKSK